jgi:hypothetical protein
VTDERLTLRQAAARLGVSESAIRKRVERGTLPSDKGPDGRRYVYLDSGADNMSYKGADASTTHEPDALISELRTHNDTLREKVAYLQGVISTRDQELALRAEEIRRRDTALEREQQLAAMFAERLRELEAPVGSSAARDSDVSPGPSDELGEVREELATEQTRREMAESTLHEGMAEEQRRREEAERERDDLRRELYALREPREYPETPGEQKGRGKPRASVGEPQESVAKLRPWRTLWRRIVRG